MSMVIVPNIVRDIINKKLDAAILICPEAEKERNVFYHQMLEHFDAHGEVPDFEITKR